MGKTKGSNSAQSKAGPAPGLTVNDSDVPVGGRPQVKQAERPEPEVISWDSTGTEVPPDSDEVVGAPVPHDRDEKRDAQIRKLLHGDDEAGDENDTQRAIRSVEEAAKDGTGAETEAAEEAETAAEGEDATAKPETDVVPAKAKPSRRDLLANLATERARRDLEAKLRDAAEGRNAAEQKAKVLEETLNSKSILKIAKARGMSRLQLLDELVAMSDDDADDADETPPAKVAEVKPDPEKEELKRRLDAIEARSRAEQTKQAEAIAKTQVATLDVPLIKASKRIAVPLEDGTVVYQSPYEVILSIAEQRWINEGRPDHVNRVDYLAPAAETLEEALREEYADILKAAGGPPVVAAAAAAAKSAAAKSKPSLGKRMAGGAPAPASDGLSLDQDERRNQIKARFGFR